MNTKNPNKDQRTREEIRELASKFLLEASTSKASLITVTDVILSPDRKYATIYFTTLPEDREKDALNFAKRNRKEFKEFIKKNSLIGRIPFVDFEIDFGERNRQNIDKLSEEA